MPDVVPEFYANNVAIQVSIWDFLLTFGILKASTDLTKGPTVEQLVQVRLSPQETVVLLAVLREQVDTYQRQIAPIAVPPQVFRDMGLEP